MPFSEYQIDECKAIRENILQGVEGNTEIDFCDMTQEWKGKTLPLSNPVSVFIKWKGNDDCYYANFFKDRSTDLSVVIGINKDNPQAFMVDNSGTEYFAELEFFGLVSVLEKGINGDIGIMTVFDKKNGINETKIVKGCPSLMFNNVSLIFSGYIDDEERQELLNFDRIKENPELAGNKDAYEKLIVLGDEALIDFSVGDTARNVTEIKADDNN